MYYSGTLTPFDHQRATTEFLFNSYRAFCFNDIGTGKTLSALWALDNLLRANAVQKVLIIAPKSTLNHTWGRTMFLNFPSLSFDVLTGTKQRRWRMLDSGKRVYVVNPDGLPVIFEHPWLAKVDLIIVDEQTYFKNSRTRRYKLLRKLVHDSTRLWMMSGSPMPQEPTDVWAPAKLVCPDRVAKTFTRFKDQHMIKVSTFSWVPRPNAERRIAEALDDFTIRFTRDDCLDLPPVTYETIELEPTKDQLAMTNDLKKQALHEVDGGVITAVNEGVHIMKLLQAACGAVKLVDDDGYPSVHWVNCKPKLEALDDILRASSGPVLIFSPFRVPMRLLKVYLEKQGHTTMMVDGGTSQTKRDLAFDSVQSGSIDALIAQPAAMSHGLTLTASNTVVWWSLPFSHETYEQANGRIIRAGQERKQMVYRLISSQVERIVMRKLQGREQLQGTLLEILAED